MRAIRSPTSSSASPPMSIRRRRDRMDGVATHYGFFVQDEWRVNTRMTLSGGLRYELRPPFEDREENISNFLRDTPNGDVVVPSRASIDLTAPGFAGSIGSTRILAAEDRVSEGLRSPTRTISSHAGHCMAAGW